jgi:hypothetical protein
MAPKMMFASGCAASATAFAASLTSNRLRSRPAGDRQQDRAGTLDRGLQERRLDRVARGLDRAVLAHAHADAEQGVAGVGHDRAHVREVEVDQAREA